MSRSKHYIHDYTDPASGHRKRLWIIPAGLGPLSRGTIPAWGATPADPWKALPDGCYKVGSDAGEAGYDELPVGQPDSPTRVFRLDLNAFVGDADLEALAGYIVHPPQSGGGDLQMSPSTSRAFDTTNVFILLSDMGISTDPVTSFTWEFCGVQVRQVEDELHLLDVRDASGTHTTIEMVYEVKTTHIIRAVMEELKPRDLRFNMLQSGYSVTTRTSIYSLIADDSGGTSDADLYIHVYGTKPGSDNRQNFDLYFLSDVFAAIRELAEDVLRDYLRDATVTWEWNTGNDNLGPFKLLGLHESDYTIDGTRAVTQVTPMFCGTMRYEETDTIVSGGWLYEGGSNGAGAGGLARYEVLHTLMHDLCGSVPCKVTYQQSPSGEPAGSIIMNFLTLGDGVANSITVDSARGALPVPTLRKGIIAGCDCDVAGARGNDRGTVEYTAWGTTEDNRRTIESVFHNQPLIGDAENRYPIDQEDFDGDLEGTIVGIGQQDLPDGMLVYMASPTFAARSIAIRIHHNVGAADGYAGGLVYDTIDAMSSTIPVVDFDGETDLNARRRIIINDWWYPWRLLALEIQASGGIPYATCARVGKIYSSWLQWAVDMTVEYQHGLALSLGSIATGITDGNAFLGTGTYLADLGGDPVLLKSSADEAKAMATVTLLAPGGVA